MSISSTHRALPLVSLILGLALASPGLAAPQKAGDPFDQLKGEWKGDGVVITDDGQPKKVSCTTKYQITGGNIVQTLYCKGDDYEVERERLRCKRHGDRHGEGRHHSRPDRRGQVLRPHEHQAPRCRSHNQYRQAQQQIRHLQARHKPHLQALTESPKPIQNPPKQL